MGEPDHVLAARHHAREADTSAGGDKPGIQASLAQAEALLAVAAAIDRLTHAVSHGDVPASAVKAPAYQVEEIRKQHPNAYRPWTPEADAALLDAHQAGHSTATLADTFGRQPSAIRSRLRHLAGETPAPQPDGTRTPSDTSPPP
jgi:hypothetical protein